MFDERFDRCRLGDSGGKFKHGLRAKLAQDIVDFVGIACSPVIDQTLELQLQVGHDIGIEEIPKFLGTEQLTQQVLVERERSGATFG